MVKFNILITKGTKTMRMWMIKPQYLCSKHLIGEHVELHMLVGSIIKNKNLGGFIQNNLIDTSKIKKRHEDLVKEMIKRGYKHESPLPEFKTRFLGKIDPDENTKELMRRCPDCKKRILGGLKK